jgi:hypothetical protein
MESWPFSLDAPWNAEQVRVWAEIYVRRDPAAAYRQKAAAAAAGLGEFRGAGPLTKARTQHEIERALRERQKRLVDAGKLHDAETCDKRRLRQILAVKGRLLELPRAVARDLAGLDADGIEAVLSERVTAMLEEFASGGGEQRNAS